MASLKARAWLSLAILDVIIAVVLFGAAGTLRYWPGWVSCFSWLASLRSSRSI